MAEKKYIQFIEKLIDHTKMQKIIWEYLDSSKYLCSNMNWRGNSLLSTMTEAISGDSGNSFKFNTEKSFFCKIQDNYVVLYVSDSNPAEMYVIPPTFKSIVRLMPEEYGEYITRLLNLVQSQFPSADAFIDDFIHNIWD